MRVRLTTIDNPFNPFTSFLDWLAFDQRKGYNSSELLARVSYPLPEFGDEINDEENERAIDVIEEMDFDGKYERFYEDGTRGRGQKNDTP